MKEGRNFKITSDAIVAKKQAKTLQKTLKIRKICRKVSPQNGTSIRINTKQNYRKNRVETQVQMLIPGNQKTVTLITKNDVIS